MEIAGEKSDEILLSTKRVPENHCNTSVMYACLFENNSDLSNLTIQTTIGKPAKVNISLNIAHKYRSQTNPKKPLSISQTL